MLHSKLRLIDFFVGGELCNKVYKLASCSLHHACIQDLKPLTPQIEIPQKLRDQAEQHLQLEPAFDEKHELEMLKAPFNSVY